MSMTRKIIMALLFIGFAGNVGGNGTFASFNASTSNPTASFATGTVVLSNTNPAQTSCLSTAGGNTNSNANANCGIVFNTTLGKPGTVATVDITLENEGSLPGNLSLYAPATCTSANDAGAYHGTGDLCDAVQMTVQRYSDSARTTASACLYDDDNTGVTCTPAALKHIDAFTDAHPVGTPLTIASLGARDGNTTAPEADAAFLRITLTFPNGTPANDNQFQGLVASWAYTWLLEQV